MKTQHTPGPWIVRNCPRTGMALIETTDGKDIAICDEGFPQANARLIAAAPELLEALTRMIPLMERYSMRSTVLEPSVDRILPQARAAIAKATNS